MEKGVVAVDETGIVNFIYRSEEDAVKKGLNQIKTNPVLFMMTRAARAEAYRCRECRKIVAVYDEAFAG